MGNRRHNRRERWTMAGPRGGLSAAEPQATYPRRWYALGMLCLAFFVAVLGSTIVFTAAPAVAETLELPAADVQWLFTASALPAGGLLFLGGRMADLLGRRRMFMVGIALFAGASLVCGLAWSQGVLIAARVVQGAATAIMTPSALSLVTTLFPPGGERNKALAIWSMLGGVGATVGLLTGGLVTDGLGWRWVFLLNLPVGAAVLILAPLLLNRDRRRSGSFDLAGVATLTFAAVALVAAISEVPRTGWASPRTIGLLVASVILVSVFIAVEVRAVAPALPPRILRSQVIAGGNLIMLVAGMAVDGMLFTLTLYSQRVLGYSAVQFGLALTVMTVISVVGSHAAQRVVGSRGPRPVAAAGMLLIGGGCLLFTGVSPDGTFAADLLPGLVLFGFGMGGAFVAGSIASLTGVAAEDSGVASALQNTSFTFGTALGVAVTATAAAAGGYPAAFTTLAAVTAAGVAVSLRLPARGGSTT